jgi:hypothetical protein
MIVLMRKQIQVADSNFLLLALAAGVATFVDIESTVHAQRDPEAVEVNSWVYGERPQRSRMYGINIPITTYLTCLAYSWKKSYSRGPTPWVWRTPLIALGIGHGVAAVLNYLNFRNPTKVGIGQPKSALSDQSSRATSGYRSDV